MQYNVKDIEDNNKTNFEVINPKNNFKLNPTSQQRNKNKFIGGKFLQTDYRKNITDDKEKVVFNKMLDEIKNDKNMEFINIFRESILSVLINLTDDEKKILMNSKTFLKDLVDKLEESMIIHKK